MTRALGLNIFPSRSRASASPRRSRSSGRGRSSAELLQVGLDVAYAETPASAGVAKAEDDIQLVHLVGVASGAVCGEGEARRPGNRGCRSW